MNNNLKLHSNFLGVKRVRFEDVCINEETFFPLSEDLISLSRGFERVEIFGDEVTQD